MDPLTFTISADWLREFSGNGDAGWTAKQLKCLGVNWPPRRGWFKRSLGRRISEKTRRAFEEARSEKNLEKEVQEMNRPKSMFEEMESHLDSIARRDRL